MSELDLSLKVTTRRLLWRMGFSTRIDVPLRAFVPAGNARRDRSPEAFTDLDVLGVGISSAFRVHASIAECKSGRASKATEQLFWLRGVADLFDADDAWLVRQHDMPDVARQLASRLGLAVLTGNDLTALEGLHPTPLPITTMPLARLFDREQVEAFLAAFTNLDKRLKPLLEYRQFDYFVYEPHRNPLQLVAHLQDAAVNLDANNPIHVALFFDLAWLYLLAVVRIVQHIRSAHLGDIDIGLQEYLFGGQLGLREKRQMAALLASIAPDGVPAPEPLPTYYPQLREIVARVLRRPDNILDSLRYAEVATATLAARLRTRTQQIFGEHYDELAAKLLADVCGFLVAAGNLDAEFRTHARQVLLDEPGSSGSRPPTSPPDEATQRDAMGASADDRSSQLQLSEPMPDRSEEARGS